MCMANTMFSNLFRQSHSHIVCFLFHFIVQLISSYVMHMRCILDCMARALTKWNIKQTKNLPCSARSISHIYKRMEHKTNIMGIYSCQLKRATDEKCVRVRERERERNGTCKRNRGNAITLISLQSALKSRRSDWKSPEKNCYGKIVSLIHFSLHLCERRFHRKNSTRLFDLMGFNHKTTERNTYANEITLIFGCFCAKKKSVRIRFSESRREK